MEWKDWRWKDRLDCDRKVGGKEKKVEKGKVRRSGDWDVDRKK